MYIGNEKEFLKLWINLSEFPARNKRKMLWKHAW